MKRMKPATAIAAAVALATLLLASLPTVSGASGGDRPEAYYTVTITNLTDAQPFTPPNWAAHTRAVDVFQVGRPASSGVQAVAENGGWPQLQADLEAAVDDAGYGISGVGSEGPIPPGGEATFSFTTDADRLSLVAMVVCTNDGFAGLDSKRLPTRDGQSRTYRLLAYDAGTEINTEMRSDLVPAPPCGEGDGSTMSNPELAENGKIRRHRTLRGVGDLDPALDWRGPVAEVVVTRHDLPATYEVTITNATDGQYLTPPNYAFHDRAADVFQPGTKASAALQGLAENGDNMAMAEEIASLVDEAGLGVSDIAPGGAMGPIAPRESVTFEVTTDAARLSVVSMVICTNDGFAGLDSRVLPKWVGDSRTFRAAAYDAGTEINTELREDLVPAPFCGEGDGSTMSNPELAEDGKIRRHRTLRGVGDLDPSLDWRGPVMNITVTRVS